MKIKILFSFLMLLVSISLFAQPELVRQPIGGNPSSRSMVLGAIGGDSGIVVTKFPDTIIAKYGPRLKNTDGLLIRVKDTLFMRDTLTKRWIKFVPSSSVFGADSAVFYTVFRSDTSRANIYALIFNKLDKSDTANMRVRIAAGPNISITGTYPNLTISATGGGADSAIFSTLWRMYQTADSLQNNIDNLSNVVDSKLYIADTVGMKVQLIAGANISITGSYPLLTISASGIPKDTVYAVDVLRTDTIAGVKYLRVRQSFIDSVRAGIINLVLRGTTLKYFTWNGDSTVVGDVGGGGSTTLQQAFDNSVTAGDNPTIYGNQNDFNMWGSKKYYWQAYDTNEDTTTKLSFISLDDPTQIEIGKLSNGLVSGLTLSEGQAQLSAGVNGSDWHLYRASQEKASVVHETDTSLTRFGIGTTYPVAPLHVSGDGTTTAAFMNGNVGIGITSAPYPLSVKASSGGNNIQLIGNASNVSSLTFNSEDNVTQYGQITGLSTELQIGNLNNNPLTFYTSGIERMRVDPNGNIGIGTATPDSAFTNQLGLWNKRGVRFSGLSLSGFDTTNLKPVVINSSGTLSKMNWPSGGSSGTVTSIATGYGLSGGTITTSGTLLVDSAALSLKYVRLADSAINVGYTPLWKTNLKANTASPTFTGTVTIPTPFTLGATSVTSTGTQLNYLNAATGTTGTTSANIMFSASPTSTGTLTADTLKPTRIRFPFTAGATLTGSSIEFDGNSTATTNGFSWGGSTGAQFYRSAANIFYLNNTFRTTGIQIDAGGGMANQVTSTRGNFIFTSGGGLVLSTSLPDATTSLRIQNNNASSTGLITSFESSISSSAFTIDRNGRVGQYGTATAGGTTGAQTINKPTGTVNFAAAATSLVVTNSLVTTSSVIQCTVQTNDATMKSVAVVAASGSFTIYANAAATGETKVYFEVKTIN